MLSREDEDLCFEAVKYALNDMTPDERQVFEQRLAEDQTVRERLAEAVRMCQIADKVLREMAQEREERRHRRPAEFFDPTFAGPKYAGPNGAATANVQPASKVERVWRHAAVWTALAVAASIMMAIVAGVGRDSTPNGQLAATGSRSGDHTDRDKLLAVAWLNSGSLNDSADEDVNDEWQANDATIGDEELAFVETDGDMPAPEADWLFEAVATPRSEPAASNPAGPQEG